MPQSKWFVNGVGVAGAWRAVPPLLAGLLLSSGCIGVSQPKAEASAPSKAALSDCPGGLAPAADGLLDDLEDGNNQGAQVGGRDGYWYTAHDSLGSEFEIPAQGFAPAEGGADGSSMAVHIKGKTAGGGDQAWGIELGLNFLNSAGEQYDASKYTALFFKAKLGSKDADKKLRVALPDANTDPGGNVCTTCFNHFSTTVDLAADWKDFTLAFADMKQRDGWGAPRPPAVTPAKLVKVAFQMGGGKPFDVWIDDVKFLECKK